MAPQNLGKLLDRVPAVLFRFQMKQQALLCVCVFKKCAEHSLSRRDDELGVFVGDQVGLVLWVVHGDLRRKKKK